MQAAHLAGKVVLVTGGTGTFGRAAAERLLAMPDVKRVIVFSRDEYKQAMMARQFTDPRLSFFLGDVRDKARLVRALSHVDVVLHAAALKQVPAIEYNPSEAVATNIVGTQNVIDAAFERDVPRVLVISSDKAVSPINLYGATKMVGERLAVASNAYRGAHGKTRISAMRYGNVVGSRGSIVELIENQKSSGTLPLTDLRMTRFWIPTSGVIDAVVEALGLMQGGEIFVPKLRSARVADIFSALAPECKTKIIGMRPGEKLHETLLNEYEVKRTRDAGALLVIEPEFPLWDYGDAFRTFPLLPASFIYASDEAAFLTPPEGVRELLGA